MPKHKIEVNGDLNVSIGEFFWGHAKADWNDKDSDAPRSSPKDGKSSHVNAHDPDIRKMIPKFGKISLQRQRAGRGGKTVTLVFISGETAQYMQPLLKDLKKSLGCGGQIEDGKIVLQGEIADRASEWFIKMGAKTVFVGNQSMVT